jgi:hypothetical protein
MPSKKMPSNLFRYRRTKDTTDITIGSSFAIVLICSLCLAAERIDLLNVFAQAAFWEKPLNVLLRLPYKSRGIISPAPTQSDGHPLPFVGDDSKPRKP